MFKDKNAMLNSKNEEADPVKAREKNLIKVIVMNRPPASMKEDERKTKNHKL